MVPERYLLILDMFLYYVTVTGIYGPPSFHGLTLDLMSVPSRSSTRFRSPELRLIMTDYREANLSCLFLRIRCPEESVLMSSRVDEIMRLRMVAMQVRHLWNKEGGAGGSELPLYEFLLLGGILSLVI